MTLEQIIDYLKNNPEISNNIAYWMELPAREAKYVDFPSGLNPRLIQALNKKGIKKLYSHQLEAYKRIESEKNVVIVTPTASGKTLSYNLPILDQILKSPDDRAIYLFPTKALSQDQLRELHDLINLMQSDIRTYTFDGDTPVTARKAIRRSGQIVITNPDMLHQGVLPHHTIWVKLFENLRYIVIDEIHHYRGVFGSHLANLIRRLRRITNFYGSKPQFICCSATVGNPEELTQRIIEQEVDLINENGAPSGKKHFVFYNPPVINKQLGIRRSVINEIRLLASHFLQSQVQFIVFARSRIRVEIITKYIKETAKKLHISPDKVSGYRGGYLPRERRAIERGLKDGKILSVVSTNALELGIDIGQLDVSILAGYPGTIASTWQQAGRAGRRNSTSLTILVASSSPLNQFIMEHPNYFYESTPENGVVDPNNLLILMSHVKCAAFEIPFKEDERFGMEGSDEVLEYLKEKNVLRHTDGKYFWMSEIYPAEQISLRSASPDNVVIIEKSKGDRVIGEVDLFSAPIIVHQEAIYMHGTNQFHVDELDWDRKKAYVREVSVDYFTDAITKTNIKVLSVDEKKEFSTMVLSYGEVNVSTVTTGYKKIKLFTHENVGAGRVHLPEIEMATSSLWLDFEAEFIDSLKIPQSQMGGALQAVANLLRNIAPFFVMSDPTDIRAVPMIRAPFSQKPTIYMYDNYPGGIGLSWKILNHPNPIFEGAFDLVNNCQCDSGCPSCIGPKMEVGERSKMWAIQLLDKILKSFKRRIN
jgi:DEAD/DEAH box helicase domain-containing protein